MTNPILDILNKPQGSNPLLGVLNQPQPKVDQPIPDDGVLATLGNYAKYIYNLSGITGTANPLTDPEKIRQRQVALQSLSAMGHNIATFTEDVGNLLGKDPGPTVDKYLAPLKEKGIGGAFSGKGVILGIASLPVTIASSLSATKMGPNGEVLPSTPEEEAHNLQTTLAIVASGAAAAKVSEMMAPSAETLAGINKATYPGLLLKSAFPKAVSGLAAGVTFGGISDLGSENQLGSMIGDGLAFSAIGALWRPFKAAGELAKNGYASRDVARLSTSQAASELLATRGLQITPDNSPIDIGAKVKAFATSSDALSAWIDSELTVGKQVILDDVDEPTVNSIVSKYIPPKRLSEGLYKPNPDTQDKLDNVTHSYKKVNVNLADNFDRASLLSETDPEVLGDIVKQTGLTQAEVESHRNYVKDQIKRSANDPTKMYKPSEQDLAAKQAEFTQKGKDIINNTKGDIEDVNGKKWVRVGSTITDGSTALPIDSPLTQAKIGTPETFNPNQFNISLPKQNFSPEFGREMNPRTMVYQGPRNTTLISSYPLASEPLAFFKKSGFLPNELVTVQGKPYTVNSMEGKAFIKLNNLSTGETEDLYPQFVTRIPKGVDSEFYKADNGEQLTRMGVLNRDTYIDNLYDRFRKDHVDLDEVPQEAFNKTLMRFANKIGMKNVDDIADLGRTFYGKMVKEVVEGMEPEEQERYERGLKNLEGWSKGIQDNALKNLSTSLSNNNMSLTSRGGGIYDIKDMVSGKVLHTVKSLDEALQYVPKTGQANGFDLDGGFTSGQPLIGGTLSDSYVPFTTKLSTWLDNKINTGRFAPYIAFTKSAISAIDHQKGTDFYPHYQALAAVQNFAANLASGPLKGMLDKFNTAIESGDKVELNRRIIVGDMLTSMKPSEVIDKFQMNGIDVKGANDIQKVGSGAVIDFMKDVREASNYNDVNTGSFKQALNKATKSGQYDRDVVNVASQLFNDSKGAAKIKLAQMLERGSSVIDENTLSRDERVYLNNLRNAHESTFGGDPFYSYLPHAQLAELTGQNPFTQHSPTFLRSINKLGITPGGQAEMDPSVILHNFRMAAIRTAKIIPSNTAYFDRNPELISFNDAVDKAQKYVNSLNVLEKDDDVTKQKKADLAPSAAFFQQHLDNVRGIPDLSEQLGQSAQRALQEMYGPSYKSQDLTRFGNALVYSSLLGLRPAFAVRDLWNVYQNAANFEGDLGAALKIMARTVSTEFAQKLMDEGKIATQKGMDLLQPGESIIDGMGRLSKLVKAASKMSDLATKWNGQQLAHIQASAATYSFYYDRVLDMSERMFKNEKSKQDAYTEMKVQKLPPTEQAFFDDLVKAGRTEQAADFMGRTMVDRLNVVYGRNNAPQAWRTSFGKLAGGFGQWVAHQVNTNIDVMTRGTRRQVIQSNLMTLAANAAVMGVGAYTGINLSRWMITPFNLPNESPLLSGILGGVQGLSNAMNLDPAIANPAVGGLMSMLPMNRYDKQQKGWIFDPTSNWAHLYLPGSYFAQSISDAVDMANGDFGPSSIARGVGFSTTNSSVSPLQDDMGDNPRWKGNRVPHKGVGAKVLSNINPFE